MTVEKLWHDLITKWDSARVFHCVPLLQLSFTLGARSKAFSAKKMTWWTTSARRRRSCWIASRTQIGTHMESDYEYLWIILHDCTVLLFAKCEVSSVEHVEHVVFFFQALACAWKIHRQCALCCVPSFWCVDPFIAVRTFLYFDCIFKYFRYFSLLFTFIWASCSFLRSLPQMWQSVCPCLSLAFLALPCVASWIRRHRSLRQAMPQAVRRQRPWSIGLRWGDQVISWIRQSVGSKGLKGLAHPRPSMTFICPLYL